ncbi:hypothetical protein KO02_23345 [Sphingobacterium sp. ML3W]|uniref:Ig-like domain-containing protein n=1 Tax=Sphingobacterium sp. ML3W TaxID=1538644 RepID=UPI0004F7E109|nr:Ig-like domain-containing protein [Sphingobacterium sp. ML3W]AIM39300.1 hypothetical protein KO02_23345 [Sphingobacterium sp. ML3W]
MLKSIIFKFFVLVMFSTFVGCSKEKTPVEDGEKENIIVVNDIRFESQSGKAIISSKVQLTVKVFPENATNKKVKWESNNHNVATVSQDGLVTTYKKGIAEITATSESGSKSAVYRLDVSLVAVEQIFTYSNFYTVMVGDKEPIEVKITPENPENPKLIWESSDARIASIGEDGIISGIAKGATKIKVSSQSNPDIFKIVEVFVIQSPNELIELDLQNINYKSNNGYITGTCELLIKPYIHFVDNVSNCELSIFDGNDVLVKKTNIKPIGGSMTIQGIKFDYTYKPYFSIKYTYRGKEYVKTLKIN